MEYTTKTTEETKIIGKQLASKLNGGELILLHGNLGAGKTTFTKGLAEGLGITDNITSPTFSLMNVYSSKNIEPGILNLVHVDTYRLEHEDDLVEIGIEDYLEEKGTVCVIEWPEKIGNLLKNRTVVNVWFEHEEGENRRVKIEDENQQTKKSV